MSECEKKPKKCWGLVVGSYTSSCSYAFNKLTPLEEGTAVKAENRKDEQSVKFMKK